MGRDATLARADCRHPRGAIWLDAGGRMSS
jgi:hypothetical protein